MNNTQSNINTTSGSFRKAMVLAMALAISVQPAFAGPLVFKQVVPGFQGTPGPWMGSGPVGPTDPTDSETPPGQPAELAFTTSQLAFDQVTFGQSRQLTATLKNIGGQPATGLVVTASGSGYTASSSCETTLAASAQCSVVVTFSSPIAGSYTGTLLATAGALSASLPLTASALPEPVAVLEADQASLSFPSTATGQTSAVSSVRIANVGSAPAAPSVSFALGQSEFGQTNDCGTIPAGSFCTVNIAFTPAAAGPRTGALVIAQGDEFVTVSLSGTGQSPSATISDIDFASAIVGSSVSQTATLTNTGIGPLSVSVPGVGSVSGAGFGFLATTCQTSLAVSESCTVTVQFNPSASTSHAGTLTVATGAGSKTSTLSGLGHQGVATVSASSLSFAKTQIGQTTVAQAVTVLNTGTAPLSISGVSVAAGATDFGQANNCGTTLAVGSSCTVNVAFTPSDAGPRTGTLALTHDGAGVSFVSLAGIGQAPSAELAPAVDVPPTEVGSSNTGTWRLTNTGIAVITVTPPTASSVTGADFSFVSTTCSATLAAGDSCLVTYRFTPSSSVEASSGRVTLETSAGVLSLRFMEIGLRANLVLTALDGASFGSIAAYTSAQRTFTLSNAGSANASQVAASVVGQDLMVSASTCGTPASPMSLSAGGSCQLTVTYLPTEAGTLSNGRLVVTSATLDSPLELALTGEATALPVVATGGTVTTVGDYKVHTFTNSGTFTVTQAPAGATVSVMVVGGGGGGGSNAGGGGGGGRIVVDSAKSIMTMMGYSVGVGAGGAAGSGTCTSGANGGTSSFSDISAQGGGGGGCYRQAGGFGASGGGAGHSNGGGGYSGGAGFYGNSGGGTLASSQAGGGGGGATSAGTVGGTSTGGAGGTGLQGSLPGTTAAIYACGGSGGAWNTPTTTAGGCATAGSGASSSTAATSGSAGSGSGGGGGGHVTNGYGTGGNGGSGVVVITYRFR